MTTTKRLVVTLVTYGLVACFTISYAFIVVCSFFYVVACRLFGIAPAQYPPRDPR